jgi:hypothetical protein
MGRHSPCEHERRRVRDVSAIAVEHRGDVDREEGIMVDHVVELVAQFSRDFEQRAFKLLVDLHLSLGLGFWERLFNVFDALARGSGSPDVHGS